MGSEVRNKLNPNTMILNILFALYVIAEVIFGHTLISQICLIAFVGMAVLLCSYKKIGNVFLIPYTLLIAWSMLMIIFGNTLSASNANSLTRTMVINLVFLIGFTMYYKAVNDADTVLQIYKISALISSVPVLINGLSSALSGQRLRGTGINSNFLGAFMAIALIILVYQMLKKKCNILWCCVQFVSFATLILISGSRTALVFTVICLYVLLVFRKPKKVFINSIMVIVAMLVIFYLIMNVSFLYDLVGKRLDSLLQYLQGTAYEDASINARSIYLEIGWKRFLENPYLGYGADCFRTIAGQYAHSNFIELLFSFGIISVIYYIPFLYCIIKLIKNRKYYFAFNREVFLLSAGIIVATFICDYFRVTYYERIELLPLNMAILTITHYIPNKQAKDKL